MNSITFPILKTPRLTLRQLSLKDQDNILELRSDPEINKYLDRTPGKTVDDAIQFINKINETIAIGNTYYWAICINDRDSLVGTICIFDMSIEHQSCEIGFELRTAFQGRGIMLEAIQAVIDFVFQSMGLNKIIAVTHFENEKSIKLLTKFNFVKSTNIDPENLNLLIFHLQNTITGK